MVHRYHVCAVALVGALLGLLVLSPAAALASAPLYHNQPAPATPFPTPSPLASATPTASVSATPFPTPPPLQSVTPSASASATQFPTPSPISSGTPVPTPPGSPTLMPANCIDLIRNGGFEWDGDWQLGWDPLSPFYNSNAAFVVSGARSMAQGAVGQAPVTTPAYSSIRQDVTLPAWATSAAITFWYYPMSNAAAGGLNRQELILLDPLAFDETVAILWQVTENGQQWIQHPSINLDDYIGRTLSVYFNARNAGDGTWTGMYLDDVSLLACGPAVVTLTPTAVVLPVTVPANGGNTGTGGEHIVVTPSAGETVISVSPSTTTSGDVPIAPTASHGETNDQPRSESPSFFDRLGGNLDTTAVLIGLGVAAFLIVLGIVWWFRRRDSRESHDAQDTYDGSQGA
ncbi:MAG: hypothetical protein KDI03_06285 [Anaerolineae bacterium]|nr:hypothetical protein [Anaerolineae bacterium]